MDKFRIYTEDDPYVPPVKVYTTFDEGNYTALQTSAGRLWAYDDPGESITVHVAAKRRYGTIEAHEQITYGNLHLMPA